MTRPTMVRAWLAGPVGRLVQMTTTWTASDLLRGAIRLATSAVVARSLGPVEFGHLMLALAWASALTAAFDLGLRVLLTRDAAQHPGRMGPAVTNAVALRLACFLPIAGVLWVGAPVITPATSPAVLRAIAVLVAAGLAYGCVAAIHHATPARLAAILGMETTGTAVECGGAIAIVVAGGSSLSLLHLAAAVQLAQLCAAVALWEIVAPRDRVRRPTLRTARALLARALPFAGSGIVANAQARVAPLLLGAFAAPAEVAAFGAAARLEGVARRLPSAALGAALPVFASRRADREGRLARRRFDAALIAFGIGAAAVLWAGAALIVRAVYGPAFAATVWSLRWAAVGLAPYLLNSGCKIQLYADGRERTALHWSAATLAIQTGACALLIPGWGASGAAAALAAGDLVVCLPLRASALRRHTTAAAPLAAVSVVGT